MTAHKRIVTCSDYVIQGWEVAIPTMRRGEVAVLTIRQDYAYGEGGLGSSIPPGATLVIRVEMFDFRGTHAQCSVTQNRNRTSVLW